MLKRIIIILVIIIQVFTLSGCTLYIGWDEIDFAGIGTIKVPRGLKLSQVDGKYYISDKPISDKLSKVYFTQTFSLDEVDESFENLGVKESNYFTDSFRVIDYGFSYNMPYGVVYGTLYCLIEGEVAKLDYFDIKKNEVGESICMVAWPDQVEKGVVKKIAKSFEPYY